MVSWSPLKSRLTAIAIGPSHRPALVPTTHRKRGAGVPALEHVDTLAAPANDFLLKRGELTVALVRIHRPNLHDTRGARSGDRGVARTGEQHRFQICTVVNEIPGDGLIG